MPDTQNPLVSIITVTFNAEATVGATMKSVAEQTATDYEHIVMDGVSTDRTLEIAGAAATERTRIISSPDMGIYDAMNKALGESNGRYVLFLNAGDRFASPTTLERYIEAVRKYDFPGVVYGQTALIDNDGKIIGQRHLTAPEVLTYDSFRDGMVVCHQAFMALRKIAPIYNIDKYRFSADYEWCLLCLQHSRANIYLGEEPVIHYLSEGMTTHNHRASLAERFRIMCRYYGTFSTLWRHVGFASRFIRRRFGSRNVNGQ